MAGPVRMPEPISQSTPAAAPAQGGWFLFLAAVLVATTLNSLLEQQGALSILVTMAAAGTVFLFGRRAGMLVVLLLVFLAGTAAYGGAQMFGILSGPNRAAFGRAAIGACGAAALLAMHFYVSRREGEAASASPAGKSHLRQKTKAYDLVLRTVTRIPTYVRRFRPPGTAR